MLNIHIMTPKESFGSNMYIVESCGEFAVIDPSVSFIDAARKHPELKHGTRYIIVTHAHFDHILEIDSWKRETGAEVLVGRYDAPALSDPYKNAYRIFFGLEKGYYGQYTELDEGNAFELGDERFQVMWTPGHTPGGVCLFFTGNIFVGDTVFADGGLGRYDLPGGDFEALMHSIKHIASLDKSHTVYPGHGRATDISEIYAYFSRF